MNVAISAIYALTAAKLVATGLEKLLQPATMLDVLAKARLAPLGRAKQVVIAVGMLELAIAIALLVSPADSLIRAGTSGVTVVYLLVVTPIGLKLLHRTGSCGCATPVAMRTHAELVGGSVGFLARNAAMVAAASWTVVDAPSRQSVTLVLAFVSAVWLVEAARKLYLGRTEASVEAKRRQDYEVVALLDYEDDAASDRYFGLHARSSGPNEL